MKHDLKSVLSSIDKAAKGPIAAKAASIDKANKFPTDNISLLAGSGALGLCVPKANGGSGGALAALAEASEALGSACASTAMVFLMHSVTAATLGAGGGPAAGKALRSMAQGKSLSTLAFSERGTGAHFYAPELTAVRNNGGVAINGRKSFVTAGSHADVYLVLVKGEEDGTADAYLINKGDQGVKFDGKWEGLGMSGNSSIVMVLDKVAAGPKTLIGAPGKGIELVFTVVAPFFLVGLAAVNVGIAAAAAGAATAHAAGRKYADGSSVAEVQFIQHQIADMDIATRQARLLVAEAARLGEAADPGALPAIMEAKVVATDAAVRVTQAALEVTGGQGYTPALPIERNLRDARAGTVMAPTNAVLKTWIGKALAGLPVP